MSIAYIETALMSLEGRSQIWMLNNILLPFPSDDSDQEKSSRAPDTDDEGKESPAALQPNYEKMKSPTAKVCSAVPNEESPNKLEDLEIG